MSRTRIGTSSSLSPVVASRFCRGIRLHIEVGPPQEYHKGGVEGLCRVCRSKCPSAPSSSFYSFNALESRSFRACTEKIQKLLRPTNSRNFLQFSRKTPRSSADRSPASLPFLPF